MKKTLSLVLVNLKGFSRNWKSIVLLLILPLILISLVFFSFNPEGLRPVNAGVINDAPTLNVEELQAYISPFINLNTYTSAGDCLKDLKKYEQYLCIRISGIQDNYILDIYSDNTREPVIWAILQRLKATIDVMQKEKSKVLASTFINDSKYALNKLDNFREELSDANADVDYYVKTSEKSIQQLKDARKDLKITLADMDKDIEDVKTARYHLGTVTDSIISLIYSAPLSSFLLNQFYDLEGETNDQLAKIDDKIQGYESASAKGHKYVEDLGEGINTAEGVKKDLKDYKKRIGKTEEELTSIRNKFYAISVLNPEKVVNPFTINNYPTYIPNTDLGSLSQFGARESANLIEEFDLLRHQIIFPIVLFLITIFLSLLISSFINLNQINSLANIRVSLIEKISFAEIMSVYISSLVIIAIPMTCLILVGQLLFKLPIFQNFLVLTPLLLLFLSVFVFLGMAISYLIRKESITLLTSTFVLVTLIFFSGFVLPIEQMSFIFGGLANLMPSTIALHAFNQVIFYNADLLTIQPSILLLIIYFTVFLTIVYIIKRIKSTSTSW